MTDSHSSSPRISLMLTSAFDAGFDAEHALQELLRSDAGAQASAGAALLRVMLLRRDYPAAQIVTELVLGEGGSGGGGSIVRATITLPTGATASGHAESGSDTSALEETERRAIGRALDILGHTIIIAEIGDAETGRPALHEQHPPQATTASMSPTVEGGDPDHDPDIDLDIPSTREASVSPASEALSGQPPSVVDAMRRANLRRRPSAANTALAEDDSLPQAHDPRPDQDPAIVPSPTPAEPESEPALEDYSWTAFWRVARPQGFNKVKVEEQIGRSIDGMTPIQVREALAETGITL